MDNSMVVRNGLRSTFIYLFSWHTSKCNCLGIVIECAALLTSDKHSEVNYRAQFRNTGGGRGSGQKSCFPNQGPHEGDDQLSVSVCVHLLPNM